MQYLFILNILPSVHHYIINNNDNYKIQYITGKVKIKK